MIKKLWLRFALPLLFASLALSFLLVAPGRLFAETGPAQFIDSPVWFSEELKEGITVVISTALVNSGDATLSGTVSFYDSETLLGKTSVSIPAKGVHIATTYWKVTAGDHRISAEFSGKLGSGPKAITLASVSTNPVKETVVRKIVFAPEREINDATPEGKQLAVVDTLENKVLDVVPKPVIDFAASFDAFRESSAQKATTLKMEAKQTIDTHTTQTATTTKTLGGKEEKTVDSNFSPFTYVKLFLGTALAFILGNQIVFYGILILLVIIGTRALINKITG